MPLHGQLFQSFNENQSNDQFVQQNKKLLKLNMGYGPIQAKVGSMVAYQGDVRFQNRGSGGLGKMIKKATTGEGVEMMEMSGNGQVFLAEQAKEIQVFYLENDMVSVNGKNVLAFSSSIEWDIHRIKGGGVMAGGLFNVTLRGSGFVAITTDGDPLALDVTEAPTFADPQAAVLWTSGVSMQVNTDFSGGLKSFLHGGTGESFQLAFGGQGLVIVQPSEGNLLDNIAGDSNSSRGSGLGDLLS
ncbi:AIM24 family protein [Corynebacterium incognita]|uniref:AIM24 family protein n=1 Tax=Corynebacterium incognita TaxID=2754725 RepID=A0A7G7CMR5_9CORY|nr:AIM24 family protein [Corynebacterium incognita]QNE88881.1 AIM24 family protein [Corynebacterium incognita]